MPGIGHSSGKWKISAGRRWMKARWQCAKAISSHWPPSAHADTTTVHDLPCLAHSASAASLAAPIPSRAMIAQPEPEWAKAPQLVPKKLTSTGQVLLSPYDTRAAATAALRVVSFRDLPH